MSTLKEIRVFGKPDCKYCDKAKTLLGKTGLAFTYIDVTKYPEAKKFVVDSWLGMGKEPTVPLIDVDKVLVGGYKELEAYISAL